MKANPLGDIRAEADHDMLDRAFVETPDYRMLITVSDRPIIVGRRGSGKSALFYALARHWRNAPATRPVVLAPEEHQVIGLRPLLSHFGDRFSLLRAASRLAWRYALLMELATDATQMYKFPDSSSATLLRRHAEAWRQRKGFSARLRNVLQPLISRQNSPEQEIANLPGGLGVNQVQDALVDVIPKLRREFVVLVDRLDEGFEPDDLGIALVDGLVLAAIDINDRIPACQTKLFARDNIGRAIAQADPDYSRDIEGQVIRLHWDEGLLMHLTCNRLRQAFDFDIENNVRAWNSCTGASLHGMAGFRKALRLTLYRPRDVLALLNQAFFRAVGAARQKIALDDLESTAHEISTTRLTDLHREYREIVPGLAELTYVFRERDPELAAEEAAAVVAEVLDNPLADGQVRQHFEIMNEPFELVRSLYSVGFLGVKDATSGAFAFCHDGRPPARGISENERVLVHPCYWMALGLKRRLLADTEAEEIHDEYEIYVNSETPEIRKARLSKHIAALSSIGVGSEGAQQFEEWCLWAARVLFAGQLTNIELHPNRDAVQRRDIVGTIVAEKGIWRRVYDDYDTRQVMFEVKNQAEVGADAYRQMLSYLVDDYGRCGFIITRSESPELRKDAPELSWTKEMYDKHGRLIVKLTAKLLVSLLSKLRSPRKHDEANVRIGKLLDDYVRMYVGGSGAARRRRRR